jgi:SagB-type dehydrogenase family enzyme
VVNFAAETVTLSLADKVGLRRTQAGTVEVGRHARTIRLKLLDPGVEAALCRLADGPAGATELEKIASIAHPDADIGRLNQELARLAGKSFLRFGCVVEGVELLRATAEATLAAFDFAAPFPAGPICLSRFAYLHRVGGTLVLDSPASHACVEVLAPVLGALLFQLARPCPVGELPDELPGYGPGAVRAVVGFLLGAGVLVGASPSGVPLDEARPELAQREFHDVAMHAASRGGVTGRPLGGTYRFHGAIPPAPAIRPLPDGPRIPLPRPDLDRIQAQDPPLARVMESRRSIRKYGAEPLTADQLGEFLFRVARVKKVDGIDEAAGALYETSRRTYPSGGATYDLEFYLTTRRCAGLGPGIYHYDPVGHQVTRVCDRPGLVRLMLLNAHFASGMRGEPQVLITLASRFARLSWKYEGIAYAATLKNVGVLQEAMYLVATAMGLAPCALGCGDSTVFSTATGLDPLVESSVGEFMLGSRVGG